MSLREIEARATAPDPEGQRFRTQVLNLTQVKLGKATNNFYPQDITRQESDYLRVEVPLLALSKNEFNKRFGLDPESIGIKPTTLQCGRGLH